MQNACVLSLFEEQPPADLSKICAPAALTLLLTNVVEA